MIPVSFAPVSNENISKDDIFIKNKEDCEGMMTLSQNSSKDDKFTKNKDNYEGSQK